MVEANSQFQEDLNALIIKAIEAEFKAKIDNLSIKSEEYEELKMRVKPKLVMASKELADAVNILKDFDNKNRVDGKIVFTQTLQFYLDALKFDQKIVTAALDQEIEAIKKELVKINQLK